MTNADKIRQMTDEELAEWLDNAAGCSVCELQGETSCAPTDCIPNVLKWLRKEADDAES